MSEFVESVIEDEFIHEKIDNHSDGIITDSCIHDNYFGNSQDNTNKLFKSIEVYKREISELKQKNYELIQKNEHIESRLTEILRMLNELLKINNDSQVNLDRNIDELRLKITSILYREIRMKHIFPFSGFISGSGGLSEIHSKSKKT
jgi:predicted RNase H-like nuclease (RuvC/YqgF family)